jgi:putative transposase
MISYSNGFKNMLQFVKVLKKTLVKKINCSRNRDKAKNKLSKLHKKISNQRNDSQHKISFRLVCENQAVVLENLNVKNMTKNHYLALAKRDFAHSTFITK